MESTKQLVDALKRVESHLKNEHWGLEEYIKESAPYLEEVRKKELAARLELEMLAAHIAALEAQLPSEETLPKE